MMEFKKKINCLLQRKELKCYDTEKGLVNLELSYFSDLFLKNLHCTLVQYRQRSQLKLQLQLSMSGLTESQNSQRPANFKEILCGRVLGGGNLF